MATFIFAGALTIGAALGMIVARNAVHAALLLVANLIGVAVLFLTLGAEFLFAAQIMVYAGAIMILFLFVIMMLGVDRRENLFEPRGYQFKQAFFGAVALLVVALAVGLNISSKIVSKDSLAELPKTFGSAEDIGAKLFTNYLLPFEVTSLLLLVAAIGILALAKRRSS